MGLGHWDSAEYLGSYDACCLVEAALGRRCLRARDFWAYLYIGFGLSLSLL